MEDGDLHDGVLLACVAGWLVRDRDDTWVSPSLQIALKTDLGTDERTPVYPVNASKRKESAIERDIRGEADRSFNIRGTPSTEQTLATAD